MAGSYKILAITGIRSEYDILYPVLDEIRSAGHDLKIAVTGAHLSDHHGNTQDAIVQDGFTIVDRIDSLLATGRLVQRSKGVGMLIQGLTQTVERENPDLLLVVGDREESIATAIVGNYTGTLVAHIGGGDPVYGNADDPIRFAVSKLAHLHCCTALEYVQNLRNIGEEEFRIHYTGNPSYVNIDQTEPFTITKLSQSLQLPIFNGNYLVLIKHPLSSELDKNFRQMEITMQALEKFCTSKRYQTICIPPNSDPGSQVILDVIQKYSSQEWFHQVPTLSRSLFVNLMRHTKTLVGNSSMGILEAPHYKLPVVNIGNRQKGRLNAGNVEFVDYDPDQILNAIDKACFDEKYRDWVSKLENPYGDGTGARKIREALESIDLQDSKWYVKKKLCP
jgi:GDP/UDP-N,N'-diacetylbacillosamine 2-epimerase (hydrolysing)